MRMIHPDIFKEFGIHVKRCYKFRGMYMCETNRGTKVIKISDYTPVQIILQYNIKQHLIEQGFTCLNQLYISNKNVPYVIYYNHVYVMMDWNNGQAADFYNMEDIKESVQILCKMHMAGEGFNNLPEEIKLIKINNLGETYEKRYRETIKLKRKIENVGNKTDFEVLYLKNSDVYKELQEISQEFTSAIQYEKLINEAIKNQDLAHGKYTYHNIVKINPDKTIITGFEKSGYDVQITDLVYLIRRIMRRNQWDIDLLLNIIEEYNKLKPISTNEWRVMKGMIIFPDRFAKICNQYYHSKRRWNYNMFHRKLTKVLDYQDDYMVCIKEVMKW